MSSALPPCGLYRTAKAIGGIPVDRLVYFHNHGDPGAGVYLPERWTHNRAHFSPKGTTVPAEFDASFLMALPAEGYFHFTGAVDCCEKKCVRFEPDQLLQIGYNGAGRALVFVPELANGSIDVPQRGTMIDDANLAKLAPLRLPERQVNADVSLPRGIIVH